MASALQMMNRLLAELDGSTKSASSLAGTDGPQAEQDPGTRRGESRHPSAKVDAQTMPGTQGARSAENEADVKHDQPVGVDRMSPGGGGSQDSRQLNIGMRQSATGEDPETERKFKDRPKDPGTSSKADAADIGEKYASLSPAALCQLGLASLNQLLSAVASTPKQASASEQEAAQAGRELADLVTAQTNKQAADANTAALIEQVIYEALTKAAAVADFLGDFRNEIKRAEAGMPPEEAAPVPGGGPPPGAEPPMPEAVMSGAPGDLGGGPEGGPAAGGQGGGHEEAIEQLVNSLIEAGISPDELMQAVSAEAGGGPAGAEGGEPKMASADRQQWSTLAKQAKAMQMSPRFRYKTANPGTQERRDRDDIVRYLREVCGR